MRKGGETAFTFYENEKDLKQNCISADYEYI